jgi:radical SAM superfamily enzyme YgiQ (UPF0313 family)
MKVLLINPPSNAPNPVLPLGLAYLAAALAQAHIEVEVIDAWAEGLSFVGLGKRISGKNYDAIGITIMSPLYAAGMQTVDSARKNSSAKIIVGGPHPSASPEECLQDNPHIDFAVIGEGERTCIDLIHALSNGGQGLESIPGVAFWQNGKIITTGHAPRVARLEELPYPAWRLFPLKKYRTHPPYGKDSPYMTLITSRGCPFSCSYCSKSVFGQEYLAMSPEAVCRQVQYMTEEFGAREVHFYDDDFTIDMARAEAICDEMLRQKIHVSWSCTTRVDLVNEKLLTKMERSGCWLIAYGVESADPTILENARKGYTFAQVEQAFRLTQKTGIRTLAYFMLGLPGETKETVQETIDFSLKLDPDFVSWGITALYPGSPLYMQAKKSGSLNVRYTPEAKQGSASASPYGDGFAILNDQGLSGDQLRAYSRKANRRFYFRPSYIFSFIFKVRSLYQFFHYVRGAAETLFWIRK